MPRLVINYERSGIVPAPVQWFYQGWAMFKFEVNQDQLVYPILLNVDAMNHKSADQKVAMWTQAHKIADMINGTANLFGGLAGFVLHLIETEQIRWVD